MKDLCPTCGKPGYPGVCPPEPPIGTWVRDKYGATGMRHKNGRWAPKGFVPGGIWEAWWHRAGPLVECGPWGRDLNAESVDG